MRKIEKSFWIDVCVKKSWYLHAHNFYNSKKQYHKIKGQPVLVRSFRYISSWLLPGETLLSLSSRECRRAPTIHNIKKNSNNQSQHNGYRAYSKVVYMQLRNSTMRCTNYIIPSISKTHKSWQNNQQLSESPYLQKPVEIYCQSARWLICCLKNYPCLNQCLWKP